MRVVGGRLRGRALAAPEHDGLRPTSDRVREAVFDILLHGIPGFCMEGARVLDLFAGTGALGIEALSRGAGFCLFVEEDAAARGLIRRNTEAPVNHKRVYRVMRNAALLLPRYTGRCDRTTEK